MEVLPTHVIKTLLNDLPCEWGFILTQQLYFPRLSDSENMSWLVKKNLQNRKLCNKI